MPIPRFGRRAGLAAAALLPAGASASPFGPERTSDPALVARSLFAALEATRRDAALWFAARGNSDAVPALILALRFDRAGAGRDAIEAALRRLTGTERPGWFQWMEWLEANPDLRPFAGYDRFLADHLRRIDPHFRLFIHDGVEHTIRLEEIAWGGVSKDGIPALTNPGFLSPGAPAWTRPEDLVFGIAIHGDARAYPLRILDWHEMVNDVVGGVPVSLAYCTLCGSGILFATLAPGRERPFVFGSSGLLWRSNKLMYDQDTHSLWNQFTGRPVVGPLAGSGVRLKVLPVTIASWRDWQAAHPATRLLSPETGHARDYSPGAAYRAYFASPALMFPSLVADRRLEPKDYVFALRSAGMDRAWPLTLFEGGRVINDRAGVLDVVLVGDAATRTVRAWRRDGLEFAATDDPGRLRTTDPGRHRAGGTEWRITEEALVGPGGRRLDRLPGHVAYWFAWAGFLGEAGELAGGG